MASGPSPGAVRPDDHRLHAEFRARANPAGIGSAVISSEHKDVGHVWDCIVSDGREWHYIRVVCPDLGPYPNLSAEDIEQAIERYAATLPAQHRMRYLLNANPLRIDPDGRVHEPFA